MAIIERPAADGSPRYNVRVRDGVGRWFPSKTFKRLVDAERHERTLLSAKDSGTEAISKQQRETTVADLFDNWWSNRLGKVSKGWHESMRQMANDYILPFIGDRKVADVRPEHIGRLMTRMTELGRSAQLRLHVYQVVHQLFESAVEYYRLVQASPVLKADRPKVTRKEPRFLTPNEAWRLVSASKGHYLSPAILLGLLAGLRTSEIQALRWQAVDFSKGEIVICAAYKRRTGVIESFPKGGDQGRVAMPQELIDCLRVMAKGKRPDDFVAPASRGGMLEQKKLHDGLRKLCKLAGVPVISPHGLRHSCSEIWISVGASAEDMRRQLNQKSVETTMRYIHQTDTRQRGFAEQIVAPPPPLRLVSQ